MNYVFTCPFQFLYVRVTRIDHLFNNIGINSIFLVPFELFFLWFYRWCVYVCAMCIVAFKRDFYLLIFRFVRWRAKYCSFSGKVFRNFLFTLLLTPRCTFVVNGSLFMVGILTISAWNMDDEVGIHEWYFRFESDTCPIPYLRMPPASPCPKYFSEIFANSKRSSVDRVRTQWKQKI